MIDEEGNLFRGWGVYDTGLEASDGTIATSRGFVYRVDMFRGILSLSYIINPGSLETGQESRVILRVRKLRTTLMKRKGEERTK